jgi:hypothetical protein
LNGLLRRVGKANGSRECAPDDKSPRAHHFDLDWNGGHRREERLCPPHEIRISNSVSKHSYAISPHMLPELC